jgi:hypothetical protein
MKGKSAKKKPAKFLRYETERYGDAGEGDTGHDDNSYYGYYTEPLETESKKPRWRQYHEEPKPFADREKKSRSKYSHRYERFIAMIVRRNYNTLII